MSKQDDREELLKQLRWTERVNGTGDNFSSQKESEKLEQMEQEYYQRYGNDDFIK